MTNEQIAKDVLNRHGRGVSAAFDEDNYREAKGTLIQALKLADDGNHLGALQLLKPFGEGIQSEIKAAIDKKGTKK